MESHVMIEQQLVQKKIDDVWCELYEIRPAGCESIVYKVVLSRYDYNDYHVEMWFEEEHVALLVLETICRYGAFDVRQALSKRRAAASDKEKDRLDRILNPKDWRETGRPELSAAQKKDYRDRRAAVRNSVLPRDRSRVATAAP